ncbi:MAG: LCP family protein [Chloroflexota bacterium]
MPTQKRISKPLLLGGLLLVLAVAVWVALPRLQQRWSAPLGPSLDLPTHTPTEPPPTSTTAPTQTVQAGAATRQTPGAVDFTLTPTLEPTATNSPTPTPEPLCGGPPVMMALAVGVDTEDDTYTYGLGDAIRVARVDFVTPKLTVLSIPRDLWVEIPGISDHYGITHGKLNQSYFYGSPGMGYYDGPGAGAGLMARTLDLNFGLRADHYGALNMLTFVRIVDAVGGIDVFLPTDIDGTPPDSHTEDMGYFYAGQNHFSGEEALRFSRIRKYYNDFTRMDHQTMVLCALREKLLTPSVLPRLPQIIAAFQDSVITDLSLEQMGQLACLLPHIKRENLLFTSLPQELFSPGRVQGSQQGGLLEKETFVLDADYDVIRDYVQQFIAGTWPNQPKQPSCP